MEEQTEIVEQEVIDANSNNDINVSEFQEEKEIPETNQFETGGEVQQNTSQKVNWGLIITFF